MESLAVRTYQAVDCRDFGRVDFRVDQAGNPFVLEINPLPCLSPEDVFTFIAKATGTTHEALINRVLDAALVRVGLIPPPVDSPEANARPSRPTKGGRIKPRD